MEISQERLEKLEDTERKMQALESGGVDSWEFYGESLEEYNKYKKQQEQMADRMNEIFEVLGEGVDQPAGHGCGYGFTSEAMDNAVKLANKLFKLREVEG